MLPKSSYPLVPVAACLAAVLLTSGCFGAKKDTTAATANTPPPGTSTPPGGSTGPPAPGSTPSTGAEASRKPLKSAQLKAALVTAKQLPKGFKQSGVAKGKDYPGARAGASGPKAGDCRSTMKKGSGPADKSPGTAAEAEATFEADKGGLTTRVDVRLASTVDDAAAKQEYAAVMDTFRKCASFSLEELGTKMTFKRESTKFPKIGDSSAGIRFKTTVSGLPVWMTFVGVRHQNNVATLIVTEMQKQDAKLAVTAAKASLTKLERAAATAG